MRGHEGASLSGAAGLWDQRWVGGHRDVSAVQGADVLENADSHVTVLDGMLLCTRNSLREETSDLNVLTTEEKQKGKWRRCGLAGLPRGLW